MSAKQGCLTFVKKIYYIPTVVFAELIPQFDGDTKTASSFLKDHKIRIENLDLDSVIIAGARWMKYLKRKAKTIGTNAKWREMLWKTRKLTKELKKR